MKKYLKTILAWLIVFYWIFRTMHYNLGNFDINLDYFLAYLTLNWAYKNSE